MRLFVGSSWLLRRQLGRESPLEVAADFDNSLGDGSSSVPQLLSGKVVRTRDFRFGREDIVGFDSAGAADTSSTLVERYLEGDAGDLNQVPVVGIQGKVCRAVGSFVDFAVGFELLRGVQNIVR